MGRERQSNIILKKQKKEMELKPKKILFICTNNSARSQMAEGLLRHFCGDSYDVYSAGTEPSKVHPYAIQVMKEIGIDISPHSSKSLDQYRKEKFYRVVTVCDLARESCPYFFAKKMFHKGFADPAVIKGSKKKMLESFRKSRDEIKDWIKETFCPSCSSPIQSE